MFDNKKLIKISKLLLYAIAVLPFILWAGFSFPYVTIRVSLFRIIIEIVMILSIVLLLQGNNIFTRLKQNYFCWIFGGLLSIELIAAIFGESFLFSFFGDLERMWGIFTVLHLYLFYILLRAFFAEKEYKIFFHVSFITSLLVSIYGIIQKYPDFFGIYLFEAGASRIPSTLGNPTYVAIYLLFNIAFALYYLSHSVIAREVTADRGNPMIRYFYAIVILVNFIAFSLTDIRGAYLGLILGAGFSSILYLFLGHSKQFKVGVASILSIGIIVIALSFIFKETSVVRSLPILGRVSTISLTEGTSKTRFIGWNAALQGFKEDPITGVGMENYNIVFDKFYPAEYYQYARTETYFDRAHNQFLNILAESGIFALLVYLCFPLFIGYYLIYGYRKEKFNLNELLIFSALAISYFVHLFFVFDDINSFLFFVAFLGIIEFVFYKGELPKKAEDIYKPNVSIIAVSVALIPVLIYSIFALNFRTLQAAKISAGA
ncbi:O-antigen ligase family protein, partial [Patescibacteria group bacterium]|nr:O-antigen ligase family protein [Patescibacteria group bacterium]